MSGKENKGRAMKEIKQADLPRLFNEWIRRHIETPSEFEADFQTITRFLAEQTCGEEPSYGDVCTAYLVILQSEMDALKIMDALGVRNETGAGVPA